MSGLRLLALSLVCCLSLPLTAEVFISEYVEGSSNNKAIEIYNPDPAAVNLGTGGYQLEFYFNGSTSAGLTIALTGSVASGDVYIVAHASSVAAILAVADQTNSSGWFNGDDAVVLRKGAAGPIVDSIGQVGFDPGAEWGALLVSTADNTLRRKTTLCAGDTNPSDVFDPSVEWDGFATDTFAGLGAHTASCSGGTILSINDVTQAEGDAGTTTFTFTVSLSAPAGPGGVTFDIATADNTATAGSDYVAGSLTGQTIPAGAASYAFDVIVNGDTTPEANETFFVNVTNITGATAGDGQGTGTISNDDVTLTPIHDVQGPGATSPVVGATVTIRGIVTGVKSNGFFVQEPDATVDADPATSEGIFVFTSSAPPAAAAFQAFVQVTGTVVEFVPSSDPQQPPLTEISAPTVVQLATAQPLPTAVPLTPTFPDPAGPHDQLERVEGMRVAIASTHVVAPSDGSVNEANNTGTSNGRFYGVVAGVARPFREPGIRHPDVPPTGTIPPIPRWDTNPELLRIESAAINGQPILTVKSGDTVGPMEGPLDYGFRAYALYPDGTLGVPGGSVGTLPTIVTPATGSEFTVVSFNLQRFCDDVNDPLVGEPVLTAAAWEQRLAKASLAIRNHLLFPDIIGVQEAENLSVLQTLAARITTDALANAQPDPQYVAYLIEGNDVGGIDVGFLVKTADAGGSPRVSVNSVTQIGASETWIDPASGSTDLLHDRPSLVLDATIHRGPASFPIVVVNNHLRSLIGVDSSVVSGASTTGDRVRRKRQTQADSIANYLQGRLTTDPAEHIVLVGDFNAFEFNDGYADTIGTISGTPSPDNETVVCATCPTAPNTADGVDLVNPDFVNLVATPPQGERYSYLHEGNAQNLDHAIASAGLVSSTLARRIEHPRINADYPETERANAASALRLSDHDPVVAYFAVAALALSDVSITKADTPDPVLAGTSMTYTITVTNSGPDPATEVTLSDTLPAGTTFTSLSAPGGWSCTTPAVGAGGTITCSIASLPLGSGDFTLEVAVDPSLASGTVLTNTATATPGATDPDPANNSATATTTVVTGADLQVAKTAAANVYAGDGLPYTITVTNAGPGVASNATLTDVLPANTTFISIAIPAGWSCTTPAFNTNGTISCNNASFGLTTSTFTVTVAVASSATGSVMNTVTVGSATPDPNATDNTATAVTTVDTLANVSVTKSGAPSPVVAGTNVTWTITVRNTGPSDAASVTLTDAVPLNSTFASLTAPAGWSCTTPAAGGTGAINCSAALLPAGSSAVFTLVTAVDPATADGAILSNTATVATTTPDALTTNDTATATVTVGSGSADLAVTKIDSPDPVTAGTNLTWTITATNAGPSSASNVTLSDTLPAGTTFVSLAAPAGWSCTTPAVGAGGSISCTNAALGVATAVFTLTAGVDASATGTLTNSATVSSVTADPNGADNTATSTTTVVASADLAVSKSGTPDPVIAGTNVTWTIAVANAGPSDATAITLTDAIPANTTFVSLAAPAGWSCTTPAIGGTGTIECSNALLAGGASAPFTLIVAVDPSTAEGSILGNTASVSTSTSDPNGANDSATATVTVGAGSADLGVTKSGTPDPVTAGTSITWTIAVANAGPGDATSVSLTDAIPANTTFASLTTPAGWTCTTPAVGATGSIDCSTALLAAGADAIFTLAVDVDPATVDGTVLTNTATVAATTADPNPANDSVTSTVTVGVGSADLSITKVASADPVNAGGDLTWTITITNAGPTNASTVVWTDTLPAETTFVSLDAATGWSCTTPAVGAGGEVRCSIAALPIGTASFTMVTSIIQGTLPSTLVSNTATVSSSTADPATGNESATDAVTVLSPAVLTATKSVSGTLLAGAPITYTIVITNAGTATQADNAGDEFVDTLPAGLTLTSATASSGTASAVIATDTVTWNGSIPPGGEVTITIQATIDADVPARTVIANQGAVSFDADGNGTNESTTVTDDPSTPGSGDSTSFAVAAAVVAGVPTLDEYALAALAALLAAIAMLMLKK